MKPTRNLKYSGIFCLYSDQGEGNTKGGGTKKGASRAYGEHIKFRGVSPTKGDQDSVDLAIPMGKSGKQNKFKFGKFDERMVSKATGHYMPLLMA